MKPLLFAALLAATPAIAPAIAMAATGAATVQDRQHFHAEEPAGSANSGARIAAILGIVAASVAVFGVITLQEMPGRGKKPGGKA